MSDVLAKVAPGTPSVVLLSGGLDSATVLAMATAAGYAVNALTFRYGQRHGLEIERARALAAQWKVARHVVVDIDLRLFGGSALTADIAVPKHDDLSGVGEGIPVTYVPARNTIFLSFALAWAETLGANDILIGVNALDYSGYPDCRPEVHRRVRADGQPRDEGRRGRPAATARTDAVDRDDQSRDRPPRPRPRRGLRDDDELLRPRSHGRGLRAL